MPQSLSRDARGPKADGTGFQTAGTSAAGFVRRRPLLTAALIYAVLSIVMVGQGLAPGRTLSSSDWALSSVPWAASRPASVPPLGTNFELADSADVFQPFLQYTRSVLPSVPLWNPYIGAGRPFVADGQSSVFSLFSLPSYVLPFWRSLAVVAILKLFLAALGTFVLARALGQRVGGALLSGVVFAFGTFFVVWLAWPLSSVFALIPWSLAATEALVRRPTPRRAAVLAIVTGLQLLGGHPESSFHLGVATVCFFTFRTLLTRRRSGGGWGGAGRRVALFAAAMAAGAGLAAIALAPFLEFILHSADLNRRVGQAPGYFPRRFIFALFLHDYWGRPTQTSLTPFMQIRGWYAGAGTLMLAAVALIARRSAERLAVLIYALFAVVMVLGLGPPFRLVTSLPGFSAAHNARMLIYFLMCLALLAGWGLDDLVAGTLTRHRRRAALACAGAIAILPLVWMVLRGTLDVGRLGDGLKVAWGFVMPPRAPAGVDPLTTSAAPIVRDSALLIWLPLAGAAVALIATAVRRPGARRPVLVAAFVVLIAADLFRANMGFNPAIPIRTAEPPVTGAIRYLQAQRPNRFVGVSTAALSQPLPTDYAMHFGLYDARGYDFPVEQRLDSLWRHSIANGTLLDFTQPEQYAGATPAALRALSLLSVRDLVLGPLQAQALHLHDATLRRVYARPDAVIYENTRALPRVFVVSAQSVARSPSAALAAVTAPDFAGREVAVTEHPVAGVPVASSPPRAGSSTGMAAHLVSYRAQRVVINAEAARPGLLVLTDDYFPGWTATVDGRPAAIQRVDYLLRGVRLPPGRHTVVMRYAPASWTIGLAISGVSLILVVLGLLAGGPAGRRWALSRARPAPAA